MPTKYTGKIIEAKYISETVKYFRIKHTEPNSLTFTSGQYALVDINGRDKRAYSIGSSPDHTDCIDFFIDLSPGGIGSKYFEAIKPDDEIKYWAPLGRFFYTESNIPALFISTGTGIAPFIGMIEYALEHKTRRKIKLLQGLRYKKDIYLQDRLDQWCTNNKNFSYDFCLSRETEWNGRKGRVTAFIEEEVKNFGKELDVYICGGKEMLTEIETVLINLGVDKSHIKYEKYY